MNFVCKVLFFGYYFCGGFLRFDVFVRVKFEVVEWFFVEVVCVVVFHGFVFWFGLGSGC